MADDAHEICTEKKEGADAGKKHTPKEEKCVTDQNSLDASKDTKSADEAEGKHGVTDSSKTSSSNEGGQFIVENVTVPASLAVATNEPMCLQAKEEEVTESDKEDIALIENLRETIASHHKEQEELRKEGEKLVLNLHAVEQANNLLRERNVSGDTTSITERGQSRRAREPNRFESYWDKMKRNRK